MLKLQINFNILLNSMQMAVEILKVFPRIPNETIKFSNTENKSGKKQVEVGISILAAEGLYIQLNS